MAIDNLKEAFVNLEFLMVSDVANTKTTEIADVVIPASYYIEKEGTYTNFERKVQKSKAVIKQFNSLANWEIILKFASKFNKGFKYNSIEEITDEIFEVNRYYKQSSVNKIWGNGIFTKGFTTKNKKANLSADDIEIKTFETKKEHLIYSEFYFDKNVKSKLI